MEIVSVAVFMVLPVRFRYFQSVPLFLLLLAACSDGDYQFRFAERRHFTTVEQPSDGNGWKDKLQFLSDTPFRIAILRGMAKDCGFKDRMVLFSTCIICHYHSA